MFWLGLPIIAVPDSFFMKWQRWAQVGAWMLLSTFELFQAIRNDTIKQHPMFSFEQAAPRDHPNAMLPANQPRSAGV